MGEIARKIREFEAACPWATFTIAALKKIFKDEVEG